MTLSASRHCFKRCQHQLNRKALSASEKLSRQGQKVRHQRAAARFCASPSRAGRTRSRRRGVGPGTPPRHGRACGGRGRAAGVALRQHPASSAAGERSRQELGAAYRKHGVFLLRLSQGLAHSRAGCSVFPSKFAFCVLWAFLTPL